MEGGAAGDELNKKKGLWTEEEDKILMDYIMVHGKGRWNRVAKMTGLKRCGKSCRLRWMNYLSPNVKRGDFTEEEEDLIIRLHKLLGNRWSLIAGRVPGRTDNQVKNHWNTHLSKKLGIKLGKRKVSTVSSSVTSSEEKGLKKLIIRDSNTDDDQLLPSTIDIGNDGKMGASNLDNEDTTTDHHDHHHQNGFDQTTASNINYEQEPGILDDEFFLRSFWFFNNDLNKSTHSLLEISDGYPLDNIWFGMDCNY